MKYYEKYHEKLRTNLNGACDYNLIINEITKDSLAVPAKKWRMTIKENLSLPQALDILQSCMISPPDNLFSLAKDLSGIFTSKSPALEKILRTSQHTPSSFAAFCKLLYDETLDLIAQACIAVLWHADVNLYADNNF